MLSLIVTPGGYAIVGAAAFSAGVTHTISVSIVICEMTGHIRHVIPILIAVLVSNAVSSAIQPSFYESLIMIKKLPYLPDIISSNSGINLLTLKQFKRLHYIYLYSCPRRLRRRIHGQKYQIHLERNDIR